MDNGLFVFVLCGVFLGFGALAYDVGRASAGDDCEAYGKTKLRGTLYVCTKATP